MILDMQKILFVGPDDKRREFLRRLQTEGVVQVEEYTGEAFPTEGVQPDSTKADSIYTAAKLLKKYEDEYPQYVDETVPLDEFSDVVEYIHSLHKNIQSLKETIAELEYKRESLAPWGNFSLSLIEDIRKKTGAAIQFWEVPSKYYGNLDVPDNVHILHISSASQREYIISFADTRIALENCVEQSVDADLQMIHEQLDAVKEDEETDVIKMLTLRKYRQELQDRYLEELNDVHYENALASMVKPLDGMLFALQGWAASEDVEHIAGVVAEFGAHLVLIEPEKKEKAPTRLKNKGVPALGQDLVTFYDTPAQSDWDPSGWVFLSFVLFFAMIMGDGGYGLTLFLLMLFLRIKFGKNAKPSTRRFFGMSLVLTFATFVYGTLFSGFYGVNLPIPAVDTIKEYFSHPVFRSYLEFKSLTDGDPVKNGILMRVSVLIGLGHISLSLLLKALRDFTQNQPIRPFANFAWIVVMWVFYFLYSETGGDITAFFTAMTTPPYGYVNGAALGVIFLASAGTLHPGKLIAGGLSGLYNGVQFFSDVLSYIRIFALGLSGSLIAIVFNDLGTQVMALQIPYVQFVSVILGVLILVFGHLLNIGLCLMGAVIHGLRLNFLEYYRWSFDGDGRPFKPFKDLLLQK